jgi:glyoxylase-like metal-dependent hydrolase (beta-lactamase superfamily II)
MKIKQFVFNDFQENTYIVYDEKTKACFIIDPGCYTNTEQQTLKSFITANGLKPKKLLNTHCHIDHVFGNNFVAKTFGIDLAIHKNDLATLQAVPDYAPVYGFSVEPSVEPKEFLEDKQIIGLGDESFEVLYVPGHSAGHVAFVNHQQKFVISGDVLFYGSIGRTDLPGGDYNTLINSIKSKLFPLGDDYTVYSGHGPATSIGFERVNNPFLV